MTRDTSTIEPDATIPSHVPTELVIPYDFAHGPEAMTFAPGSLDEIRKTRPKFYSSYYGGFWVFTDYDDIRAAFQDYKLFPQDDGLPPASYGKRLPPLMVDPPEHGVYRKVMTPMFSPLQIRRLEPIIREIVRDRLALFGPTGKMEFAGQFSLAISSAMFCGLLDLPLDNFPVFHEMSFGLIYGTNTVWKEQGASEAQAHRLKKMSEIREFLSRILADRRKQPGEDIFSIMLGSKVYDRDLTEEEMLDIANLTFFAGTDSTAGSISYAHAYLAQHTDIRDKLIANIDKDDYVWNASEELTRYHGFHHMTRTASRDAEFAGIKIRKGDVIVLPTSAANHDPERFPDPLTVDLERKNARTHLTFGAGIHRCLGSSLATTQLRIALQEVHRTIPDYRLEGPVEYVSGGQKIVPHTMHISFTPTGK